MQAVDPMDLLEETINKEGYEIDNSLRTLIERAIKESRERIRAAYDVMRIGNRLFLTHEEIALIVGIRRLNQL